jgi:hypothetical protein
MLSTHLVLVIPWRRILGLLLLLSVGLTQSCSGHLRESFQLLVSIIITPQMGCEQRRLTWFDRITFANEIKSSDLLLITSQNFLNI